jgi:hypothetical protein
MNSGLSLSVFTIEIDWKPVVAFACRKQTEAEAISAAGGSRCATDCASAAGWLKSG